MFYHKNADYKIVKKSFLCHSTEEFTQSQIVQIVMNLIFNDNVHSMILKSILFSSEQQAVINSLSNKQTLTLHSHFNDHDDNFLKRIRIKKSADYYSKSL